MALSSASPIKFVPIEDPTDPAMIDMAKFAVAESNKKGGTGATFVKLDSGKQKFPSIRKGTDYELIIIANADNAETRFRAVVKYKPLKMLDTLISWNKL